MEIFTIGHSTRSFEEFLELLELNSVAQVADVRSSPSSHRHPQFNQSELETALRRAGITYRWFKGLGGFRRPIPGFVSPNTAWTSPGFRSYADYTLTPEFEAALEEFIGYARAGRTAIMCAEALWWRCHRRLISDALLTRGIRVLHISGPKPALAEHELPRFALEQEGKLIYPAGRED